MNAAFASGEPEVAGDAVVITGMGCVTAAGLGVAAFERMLFEGRSGVAERSGRGFDQLRVRHSASVPNFKAEEHFAPRMLQLLDPFSQFALLAAEEAVSESGIATDLLARSDTAVVIGTGAGGTTTQDDQSYSLYAEGRTRVDPFSIPRLMPSAAASQVSIRFNTRGPSFAVSSACASAAQAIGIGLAMVRSGVVRRALVGGSDACANYGSVRGWEALRVLTPDLCRPFSMGRSGMVLGEGAGVLLIERLGDARERNAQVHAIVSGYGTSSDGRDILKPDPEGCAETMRSALVDARISADQIDHINAHGTGTMANDSTEAAAIHSVFGGRARDIPVTSTKPMHGHTIGAAGAIELIATALTLKAQMVPPCLNFLGADPSCALDVVTDAARSVPMRYAMSNSFAFGGINATLVLERHGA